MAKVNTIREGMDEKWEKLVNIFMVTNSVGLVMLLYITIRAMFENLSYGLIPLIPLCIFAYFEYKLIKTKKTKDIKNLGFCLKVSLSIVGLLY